MEIITPGVYRSHSFADGTHPIERVWKRLRRKCLHNVYFSKLAQLVQTVTGQLEKWSEPNEELARLCRI